MTLKEFYLKQKEANRKRTNEVLGMIKPEHMAWKPADGALSVGETLRHLWVSEERVRHVALDNDFSYYETRIPQGLEAVLGIPGTLAEELANIERVHRETLTEVTAQPEELFDVERVNEKLGYRRKIAAILFGLNEHEIHHRAQLMTYLRMLGTPVAEPFQRPGK